MIITILNKDKITEDLEKKIIEEASKMHIFFNDLNSKHFIFDFKMEDISVSSTYISNDFKVMELEVY